MSDEFSARLSRMARQTLESLAAAGITHLPRAADSSTASTLPEPTIRSTSAPVQPRVPLAALQSPQGGSVDTADLPAEDLLGAVTERTGGSPAVELEILREQVKQCTACQELASTRKQTVFGVGNPHARLCFLGEAPGADEDRLGEPFVGKAGQLLDRILAACRLERSEVYILNILKCRPPGNRNPSTEEAGNCRQFLERQLEIISPEFICCLGSVAAQNLLATTDSVGRLRGRVHRYGDIKVVCTYHPAYLLRNPDAKKHAWEDMKLLMREMGTPVD